MCFGGRLILVSQKLTVSVDAMGGDRGPEVILPGANRALEHNPDLHFLLFGDEGAIAPILEKYADLQLRSRIIHADVSIAMDAKPSQALRKGRRKSSMWMAVDAVKEGKADFALSAGNTGALMAISKLCLKTLPGIERPAIAAIWPTLRGECIVLDVGANVGANATQLVDFALMGSAMARAHFDVETPSVGLLNIGVEEIKGLDEIKKASQALRDANLPIDYRGFVEGNDIGNGEIDVIVAEGFTGNIALKTAEGTVHLLTTFLRNEMKTSLLWKAGAFLAKGAFESLKKKISPNERGGGTFVGLNGIVIKSHGGNDAKGHASAIGIGCEMAYGNLTENIAKEVEKFHQALNLQE
jgi:glycerol-3-phosphate acyltransferase PlsX